MGERKRKTLKTLNKGTFQRALVAICFNCHAVTTLYRQERAITLEEAEQQREVLGWTNTPKGFYCKQCQERDAELIVAAVDMFADAPVVVNAVTENADGQPHAQTTVSAPLQEDISQVVTTTGDYRVLEGGYQASLKHYQNLLHALDLLEKTVQAGEYGQDAATVRTLAEEMIAVERASIESIVKGLRKTMQRLTQEG